MQPVKMFGLDRYRHSGWLNHFVHALNAGIRLEKIRIVLQTVRGAVSGLQLVAIVWVGGHELLGNAMSVGMLYAFLIFARRFSAQAQSLLVTLTEMYMTL